MSKESINKRGSFSSSLGFVIAAAGSAIGLGNLWKFPYIAGSSGGGLFLLLYILFVIILGIPLLLAEMSLGRKTQLSAVGAYKSLNKKWSFVGGICVACSFIILSYYSVVGGWVLKYCWTYLAGGRFGVDKQAYFSNFISNPTEPAMWHILFIGICAAIIILGVEKGIEASSKILLPGLFVLIIIVAIRSCTLEGSLEGIKFMFVPKFEAISDLKHFIDVVFSAMGQVFFSLSLGLGITITYGSYLKKDTNLQKNSLIVSGLDTLVAVLAGLAIFPAVFAFGYEPAAGPGLIFGILPAVFESMSFGSILGFAFFVLIFIAAATSAMALLEVTTAFLIDNFGWKRVTATITMASLIAIVGVFASLSMGSLSNLKVFGLNIFNVMAYLTDKILMPLGAMFMCIFVGYILGPDKLSDEIEYGSKSFKFRKPFSLVLKYIAPLIIAGIFVMGLFTK